MIFHMILVLFLLCAGIECAFGLRCYSGETINSEDKHFATKECLLNSDHCVTMSGQVKNKEGSLSTIEVRQCSDALAKQYIIPTVTIGKCVISEDGELQYKNGNSTNNGKLDWKITYCACATDLCNYRSNSGSINPTPGGNSASRSYSVILPIGVLFFVLVTFIQTSYSA